MPRSLTAGGPRTLVLGDSWFRGLANRSHNTASRFLPDEAGSGEVLDLAKVSRIASDVVADHLDEIDAFAPQLAFVAIGGAESLIFPRPFFQKLIDRFFPPDWQGINGLQPSALPVRGRQALRARLEVLAKVLLKQVLVNVFGPHRRMAIADYEVAARTILQRLQAHGTVTVLIGVGDVDGWTSPKTSANIRATNALTRRLAAEYPRTLYVDARPLLHTWDDYLVDHVHLARSGHRAVADGVFVAMAAAGQPWASHVPATADSVTPAVGHEDVPVAGLAS